MLEDRKEPADIVFCAYYHQIVRKKQDHEFENVHVIEDAQFDIDLDPYFTQAKAIFDKEEVKGEFLKRDNLPDDQYYEEEEEPEENIVESLEKDLLGETTKEESKEVACEVKKEEATEK